MRSRTPWLAPLVAVVALVATGCSTHLDGMDGRSGPRPAPVTLIVSDTWVRDHQADPGSGGAAGGSDVQARLTTLQHAIDRLRNETGTGWVGRQDDVTGYLSGSAAARGRARRRRSWTPTGPSSSASTRRS